MKKRNFRDRDEKFAKITFQVIREEVLIRDDYKCQNPLCPNKGKDHVQLQAHHIKPWRFYPHLRFEQSNVITFCEDCHDLADRLEVFERDELIQAMVMVIETSMAN